MISLSLVTNIQASLLPGIIFQVTQWTITSCSKTETKISKTKKHHREEDSQVVPINENIFINNSIQLEWKLISLTLDNLYQNTKECLMRVIY